MIKEFLEPSEYDFLLKLFKSLVPEGRTHRLSVFVAGCLHYIHDIAEQKRDVNPAAERFAELADSLFDDYDENSHIELEKSLKSVFKDAKVKFNRTASRGDSYSIVDDAMEEFITWFNMPWE